MPRRKHTSDCPDTGWTPCPACGGFRRVEGRDCPACGGSGIEEAPRVPADPGPPAAATGR